MRSGRRAAASLRAGVAAWIVAALFAAAMLFGWSFDAVGNTVDLVAGDLAAILRTLACGAAWTVVAHAAVCWLFDLFDRLRLGAPSRGGRAADGEGSGGFVHALRGAFGRWTRWAMDEHPFRGPLLTLAVLWAPVLIGYAPALFMWDTDTQILQWFNLPNHLSSSVELLAPDVLLTQHHPPLHTALVGLCVQRAISECNENLGIFLYALIQWSIDILAIAWAFRALAALGAARRARIAAFAFTALVPAFSNYSVLVTKDVLFAAALLVYAVELVYLVCGVSSVPDAASDAAGASAPRSASFPAGHVALLAVLRLGGDASAQRHGGRRRRRHRGGARPGARAAALRPRLPCRVPGGEPRPLAGRLSGALDHAHEPARDALHPVPAGGALYARQSRAGDR